LKDNFAMPGRFRTVPALSTLQRAAMAASTSTQAEDGHAMPLIGTLISGIGSIALGIGAANDTGWLAITGGIVAFVGAVATVVLNHVKVEYGIYARLEALEGKK
jgi:hypothetical protein